LSHIVTDDETTGEGLIMSADGDTMQDEVSMQLETSGESSNQEGNSIPPAYMTILFSKS